MEKDILEQELQSSKEREYKRKAEILKGQKKNSCKVQNAFASCKGNNCILLFAYLKSYPNQLLKLHA